MLFPGIFNELPKCVVSVTFDESIDERLPRPPLDDVSHRMNITFAFLNLFLEDSKSSKRLSAGKKHVPLITSSPAPASGFGVNSGTFTASGGASPGFRPSHSDNRVFDRSNSGTFGFVSGSPGHFLGHAPPGTSTTPTSLSPSVVRRSPDYSPSSSGRVLQPGFGIPEEVRSEEFERREREIREKEEELKRREKRIHTKEKEVKKREEEVQEREEMIELHTLTEDTPIIADTLFSTESSTDITLPSHEEMLERIRALEASLAATNQEKLMYVRSALIFISDHFFRKNTFFLRAFFFSHVVL